MSLDFCTVLSLSLHLQDLPAITESEGFSLDSSQRDDLCIGVCIRFLLNNHPVGSGAPTEVNENMVGKQGFHEAAMK